MSFFIKIRVELLIFFLLILSIFVSYELDIFIKTFFERITYSPVITTSSIFGNIYLKKFFLNITELGNSLWYFLLIIFSLVFFFIIKKINIYKFADYKNIQTFFFRSLVYVTAVGFVTQIIKRFVGRPRPNHTDFSDDIEFNFFTSISELHSFPSGHSSTIFMVSFILASIMPKLKYLLFFFASIVAFSRVVNGAHFFTDILGGMIVAIIIFKTLNLFFYKKSVTRPIMGITFLSNNIIFNSLFFLFICSVFVTVAPFVDLYLAGLFFREDREYGYAFMLQSFDMVSIFFRDILLPCIIIYILIIPIFSKYFQLNKIYFGYRFSLREIIMIWFSQIVTVLIVVNGLFKVFWGRARPDDVIQLGGLDNFTPWYQISNACNSNCSFVSGDASVGFSIIILYFITKNEIYIYLSMFLGCILGLIRIMAGGHFISDIIFAGIIIIILNLIFYQGYKKLYEK